MQAWLANAHTGPVQSAEQESASDRQAKGKEILLTADTDLELKKQLPHPETDIHAQIRRIVRT